MSDHPSDLAWDQLLAGERDDAATLRAHAESCSVCGERLHMLKAGHDAFAARPMPAFAARPKRRAWLYAAPVVVAALALVVVGLAKRPEQDDVRIKGTHDAKLQLFAGAPGHLAPVRSGDRVAPGTYLQASYSAETAGFGAVISKDGAGSTNAYVPSTGTLLVPLAAGVEHVFPESTELDDVLGTEHVVIIWCATQREVAPFIEAVRTGAVLAPEGCVASTIDLAKQAVTP
ncbi:MAG TPA: hypothetical protein VMZ53_29395 [Kofleriaceae bacterium]|nr:hypothetical protein [Kofleriaceae bacterium]